MKKLLLVGMALISFNCFSDTDNGQPATCKMKYVGKPCPRCCAPWEQPDPCCSNKMCRA